MKNPTTDEDAYEGQAAAYDNNYDHRHAMQTYDEAIKDYSEAIRQSPTDAAAYYGRGRAYDGRGIEQDDRDDYDRAIQDYNEAVSLGLHDAGLYRYRGFAYNHEGDFDRAIQELDESIRLNPKDPVAHISRGAAYTRKGDYDRAIQDFDEALRLRSRFSVVYGARGEAYLLQANLAAAISDFEKAISGAPTPRIAVSTALLLHVAMKRAGRDDTRELAKVAAAADLSKWPGPLLKLEMGNATSGEVMAAAASPDDDRRKWHVCQANYWVGEDALLRHQKATALARLRAARDACPKWDMGYAGALAELKSMSAPAVPAK